MVLGQCSKSLRDELYKLNMTLNMTGQIAVYVIYWFFVEGVIDELTINSLSVTTRVAPGNAHKLTPGIG